MLGFLRWEEMVTSLKSQVNFLTSIGFVDDLELTVELSRKVFPTPVDDYLKLYNKNFQTSLQTFED
jgi:hypothetical protein